MMNGQHFKEIVETIMKTTRHTKKEISKEIGFSVTIINRWILYGVPKRRVSTVISRLKGCLPWSI